jgi:hypothetical protein
MIIFLNTETSRISEEKKIVKTFLTMYIVLKTRFLRKLDLVSDSVEHC